MLLGGLAIHARSRVETVAESLQRISCVGASRLWSHECVHGRHRNNRLDSAVVGNADPVGLHSREVVLSTSVGEQELTSHEAAGLRAHIADEACNVRRLPDAAHK